MRNSLIKETAVYGFVDFLFRLITFFTFPFFANVLSMEQFGLVALAATIPNLLSVFFVWGHHAVERYYWDESVSEERRAVLVSTTIWSILGSVTLFCLLALLLLFPFRSELVAHTQMSWWLWVSLLLSHIPTQMVVLCTIILRLHFAAWKFAILTATYQLLTVIFTLALVVWRHLGVEGYVAGVTAAMCIVGPICLFAIRRELKWAFDWPYAKMLWRFGYPYIFSTAAYWLFSSVDRWMLEGLSNLAEVGLYATAFKFATLLICFIAAFNQAWNPYALRARTQDSAYRAMYGRVLTGWCYLLLLVGATLLLFNREVLLILVPPPYWAAARVAPFLILGVVLYGTTQVTSLGIAIEKKTHLFAWGSWLAAAVNIALNWWLIPYWGAVGAAVTTLFSYGLLSLIYLLWNQHYHPIPIHYPRIVAIGVLLTGSALLSLWLEQFPWGAWQIGVKGAWMAFLLVGGYALKLVTLEHVRRLLSSVNPRTSPS